MSSPTSESEDGHRAGFAAVVGRPNVGKSTLMNALVGERISIATRRPQTTRNRIIGLVSVPERGQIIFIDTPGVHQPNNKLHTRMVDAAIGAIGSADTTVMVIEAESAAHRPEEPIWGADRPVYEALKECGGNAILAINKVDLLTQRERLLPAMETLAASGDFVALIPCSAEKGTNVEALRDEILAQLPVGPALYPDDILTNRPERFIAAEMVREQVFLQTNKEIPYSVAVTIERFRESETAGRIEIYATISVERNSQKGIIIGRGGARLKAIGTAARHALEEFFGRRVHLETFVRVQSDWTDDPRSLDRLGYGEDEL